MSTLARVAECGRAEMTYRIKAEADGPLLKVSAWYESERLRCDPWVLWYERPMTVESEPVDGERFDAMPEGLGLEVFRVAREADASMAAAVHVRWPRFGESWF